MAEEVSRAALGSPLSALGESASSAANGGEPAAESPGLDFSSWQGEGEMPVEEATAILQQIASMAHDFGGEAAPLETMFRLVGAGESARRGPRAPADAARTAELRYRALVERIPAVTFLAALDESASELYVSPQIEQLLGFTAEEWLSDPFLWYRQLHPDDRERWQKEFARTCAIGVHFRAEYRFIARDGRTVWVYGDCQIIRDEEGYPVFLQGFAFDITHRKEAEEAMKRMHVELERQVKERTAELARSNEDLRQFAYVASHDLQEPLRMMGSFAQLLAERYRGKLDQDADEFIHYIVDGSTRMQHLINDLLTYSRVGRPDVEMSAVQLNRAFQIACRNLLGAIEETGAKITSEDLPTVFGSETQFVQLLQNLIGNGIKFRHKDRPVRIHVGARRGNGEWVISVTDNGIGFDPQYAEKVFTIFQRLHNRGEYEGTGIGLAVCRKIVERHGGRIRAQSRPGDGTTFSFTLPGGDS